MRAIVTATVLVSTFLVGCQTSGEPHPRDLRLTAQTVAFTLQENYSFRNSTGMGGESIMPAGAYVRCAEDGKGDYYVNEKRTYFRKDLFVTEPRFGGVYVPRDTTKPPRLFYFLGSEGNSLLIAMPGGGMASLNSRPQKVRGGMPRLLKAELPQDFRRIAAIDESIVSSH